MMRRNDFTEARKIITPYTRHENPKKAAIAYFNLALIGEMEDNFDLALRYITISHSLYKSAIIADYLAVLEKRFIEKKAIDNQLIF